MKHLNTMELETGLQQILQSPLQCGKVKMIVCRPKVDERAILEQGKLDVANGLIGDNWISRGSSQTKDGVAHPEMQLNIMNSRVVALVAQTSDRWPLAGDQFYIDLNLSKENLPAGTQLQIGTAIVEVTPIPHLGCKKFVSRFGLEAMKFVNSKRGKHLNLRGINAKVVKNGIVQVGDSVRKIMIT